MSATSCPAGRAVSDLQGAAYQAIVAINALANMLEADPPATQDEEVTEFWAGVSAILRGISIRLEHTAGELPAVPSWERHCHLTEEAT